MIKDIVVSLRQARISCLRDLHVRYAHIAGVQTEPFKLGRLMICWEAAGLRCAPSQMQYPCRVSLVVGTHTHTPSAGPSHPPAWDCPTLRMRA